MGENGKKEKRPTAHEKAAELLKRDPALHFATIATLYAEGTVVPVAGIPDLIEALNEAGKKSLLSPVWPNATEKLLSQAVQSLETQKDEAESKKAEKVEEKT